MKSIIRTETGSLTKAATPHPVLRPEINLPSGEKAFTYRSMHHPVFSSL